ncbi:MAG TPA: DUF1841 family protein [bacterium]|nr:DUF1841 family protein [bacterium]
MEKSNPYAKQAILEVVENQLKQNDPPETRETLNRLIQEGYSAPEAKEFIATVLVAHMFDMLKNNRPYDNSKYIKDLANLPKLPWD